MMPAHDRGASGDAAGGERRPAARRPLARRDGAHRRVEARPSPDRAWCGGSTSTATGRATSRGHGGEQRAVLVYQIDVVPLLAEAAAAATISRTGSFGENFTVDGLPDDEVCIGDRYRIGDAVFEVTQPRVTCYRVGLRMDEPRMAGAAGVASPTRLLPARARRGRRAGRETRSSRSPPGPEAMTVAEIDALLYLPGHPRERLAARPAHPGAQPGLEGLAAGAARPGRARAACRRAATPGLPMRPPARRRPGADSGRCRVVARRRRRAPASSRCRLAARRRRPAAVGALPGQFLTVRLARRPARRPLIRSYSLSGRPGDRSTASASSASRTARPAPICTTHVRAGDLLDVAAPRGTLHARAPVTAPVLLLSAGVGATPVLAMLHALAADRVRRARSGGCTGRATAASTPFAAEARALVAALPHGHAHVCYSRPAAGDQQGRRLRDARAGCRRGPARRSSASRATPTPTCAARPRSCRSSRRRSSACGLDRARIRTEIFGAGPALTPGVIGPRRAAAAPAAGRRPVRDPRSRSRAAASPSSWDRALREPARAGRGLRRADALVVPHRRLPHLRDAACCPARSTYSPEPVEAPADGNVLICCAQPRGDVVLDL